VSPIHESPLRISTERMSTVKDVYEANIQGNVGTDELGVAVFVYDRNGELVSRKALKFALGVDQQKSRSLPNAKLNFARP
jgi:hypothetical protein